MKTLSLARAAGVAGALSLIAAVQTAHAETLTLQNDGFVDGDSIGLQSGFVDGEAAGLSPLAKSFARHGFSPTSRGYLHRGVDQSVFDGAASHA